MYARVFELFDTPLHPYTRGLFNSIPLLNERKHRLTTVEEVVRDPAQYTLPHHDGTSGAGLVPWWPDAPSGVRPEIAKNSDEYPLVQVSPTRWVGCFNTQFIADHLSPRPDLDFRRHDVRGAELARFRLEVPPRQACDLATQEHNTSFRVNDTASGGRSPLFTACKQSDVK